MITWFKTFLKIVREYDGMVKMQNEISSHNKKIFLLHDSKIAKVFNAVEIAERAVARSYEAVNFIKDRTEVNADINVRGRCPNTLIVIGRYKGRDHVEIFDVENMEALVDQLRRMQKYHHRKIIDGPPQFKAFIDNAVGD